MSSVQPADSVVAILCADLHLAVKPPLCRRSEDDWFEAMKRPLDQIKALARTHDGAPVICAGDVFDRWNSPPELVNFALENLPDMYAVPGQHDLPLHCYDLMHKSAFGTLVLAAKIFLIQPPSEWGTRVCGVAYYGFPWGVEICPPPAGTDEGCLRVAVIHSFVWMNTRTGYPGVSDSSHLRKWGKALKGYDVAVFGDNHKGFLTKSKSSGQVILNCGAMMRRRSDEVDYRPRVGLLKKSGDVELVFLDTSSDRMEVPDRTEPEPVDLSEFVASLENLGDDPLDFREAVKRALDECSAGAAEVLREVLELCNEE